MIATAMLMIIATETKRVAKPAIVSAPPIISVYADSAALNAGYGIPHSVKFLVKVARSWVLAHPLVKKKYPTKSRVRSAGIHESFHNPSKIRDASSMKDFGFTGVPSLGIISTRNRQLAEAKRASEF